MATEEDKHQSAQDAPNMLEADELFAGQINEEILEQQVFVGNEDFYKSLVDFRSSAKQPHRAPLFDKSSFALKIPKNKVLAVLCVALIGILLLRQFPKQPAERQTEPEVTSSAQTEPPTQNQPQATQPAPEPVQSVDESSQEPEQTLAYPVSLKVAQDLYQTGKYQESYEAYKQLSQSVSENMTQQKSILRLRMAMCTERNGDKERASQLFDLLTRSGSPFVSVIANYQLCILQMQKGNYLRARSSICKAMSLINAIDLDRETTLSLQQNADFFAAEAITRHVLFLSNQDSDLPAELWKQPQHIDPMMNLDEDRLQYIAGSGLDVMKDALLAPRVKQLEQTDGTDRWYVVCSGASIEELLSRFAAEANLDILWGYTGASDSEAAEIAVRKRPINIYLPAATINQLITIATGSVGLIAKLENDKTIRILNPEEYSSLSDYLNLLTEETTYLWQRFLLNYDADPRTANVHFALGLLHYRQNRTTESIAEYKLVANRFSNCPLSPYALLYSSRIKTDLRNYTDAIGDLKELVVQYPDSEIADQCYMYLAQNTLKAGLKKEAAKAYIKAYSLSLSSQAQSNAALGASKCYYDIKDYESAIRWLTQYITLAENSEPGELWLAYCMLGKSYLAQNKSTQACRAFEYALSGQLSREQYVETISVLISGYIEQGQYVHALAILEDIEIRQLSQKDSVKIILLKSKVLRAMGLFDKAVALLGNRAEYIIDPELSAQISFELAKCHIDQHNWRQAEKKLMEVLVVIKSGPLVNEATVTLANVCLQLERDTQTITLCRQLLDSDLSDDIRQRTTKLLVSAYNRQKDYNRAALALMGKLKGNENQEPKM